jgi:hypothetical protein
MPQQSAPEQVINYVPLWAALSTAAGIFITAIITNWLTRLREERKIKQTLIPDLIKHVHTYYNLKKLLFELGNKSSLNKRSASLLWTEHRTVPVDSESKLDKGLKNLFEWQYTYLNEGVNNTIAKTQEWQMQYIEAEGAIRSILTQINVYYGPTIFKQINSLLKPHLQPMKESFWIYDYASMDKVQLDTAYKDIDGKVAKFLIVLNGRCENLIREINSLRLYRPTFQIFKPKV